MKTMKAVTQERYGGPEVLTIKDVTKPTPAANELLVKVAAVPITTAASFMREGSPFIGRLALGLLRPKNSIPGVCFSGRVESIGAEVEGFEVGDTVCGETLFSQGTQAEYVCVPQGDVIAKKPPSISHIHAAPICDGHITSLNFLTHVTPLKPGQHILIIGASGSLGTAAVQIAKEIGAHVTAVCSTRNIAMAKDLGADAVIDRTSEDFTRMDPSYDVIFDTVGKSSFAKCKRILKKRGVYMSPVLNFGLLCRMLWTSLFNKKSARFAATGLAPKSQLREMVLKIIRLMEAGKLKTIVDRQYDFNDVIQAHTYVDKGSKRGNVVVNISTE